ncbi:hypothetical protein DI005_20225 [Prauserella sp. PE36]|uniref:hypothetical protein n=1 Tax=Prauserella sp. PE36 TaxID=1504709 RepID=UPI000DE51DFF|nr:hypothetical protein [Prauserella sp. PE36]RBM18122.1 hypothetical protein DI005_20225 [Prauserella sp. PE36]
MTDRVRRAQSEPWFGAAVEHQRAARGEAAERTQPLPRLRRPYVPLPPTDIHSGDLVLPAQVVPAELLPYPRLEHDDVILLRPDDHTVAAVLAPLAVGRLYTGLRDALYQLTPEPLRPAADWRAGFLP